MTGLFAHHWVLPGQSRIEDRVAAAQAYVTKSIRAEMIQAVGSQCVQHWVQNLSAVHDEGTREALFEWLCKPTTGTSQINIAEVAHRLVYRDNLDERFASIRMKTDCRDGCDFACVD